MTRLFVEQTLASPGSAKNCVIGSKVRVILLNRSILPIADSIADSIGGVASVELHRAGKGQREVLSLKIFVFSKVLI